MRRDRARRHLCDGKAARDVAAWLALDAAFASTSTSAAACRRKPCASLCVRVSSSALTRLSGRLSRLPATEPGE